MAMERAEFDALVARLETFARDRPDAYRLRVAAMALLGYAYLALMLLVLLALLIGSALSVMYLKLAGIKLLMVVGAFVWLVVNALWVKLGEPDGIAIDRRRAPALFERIERLRKALGAPHFHRVLVTDDFNAAVVQTPRLGLFGWHRNTLLLGLPLLKSLSVEQLDAVLAHEFGHLAGGHARFSNWLYRLRAAWSRLLDALQRNRSAGSFLFRRFFDWFVPRFSAYSFPLARANEYEADAVSARLTSPQALAQALTGVSVIDRYLSERYWPGVHAQADHQPQPAFAPFAHLDSGLRERLDGDDTQRWLHHALALQTTSDDTHPALSDRLRALGQSATLAPPATGESADCLLGPGRQAIIDRLDRAWQDRIAHDWRQRYQEVQQGRQRLAELSERAARETLGDDEALERARLDGEFGDGREAAMAQIRAVLAHTPDHAIAHYLLGTRLLEGDDAEGIGHVERAMSLEPQLLAYGHQALRDFHARHGNGDAAREHHDRVIEQRAEQQAAEAERDSINLRDKFLPHGLDAAVVAAIRDALKTMDVREAWLVRKHCQHLPDQPLYILGFRYTKPLHLYREQRCNDLVHRIASEVAFPGQTLVIHTEGDNTAFADRLRRVADSRVV